MCGPLAKVVDSVRHRMKGVRKRAQDVRHMEEKRFCPSTFPTLKTSNTVGYSDSRSSRGDGKPWPCHG